MVRYVDHRGADQLDDDAHEYAEAAGAADIGGRQKYDHDGADGDHRHIARSRVVVEAHL